ncbi:MAG: FAD-dependent oxidoreductase, partial [Eubacterium sp.]|nr:FAD-dependent oxidoreductase [Eubacterium sp.]
SYGEFASCTKGAAAFADLGELLPESLKQALIHGMERFDGYIPGFGRYDAILSGIESRTSSPIRIPRGEDYRSIADGIYPCGEGAGYAGGIMSAAMDGIKVAEAIGKRYAIR